MLINNRSQMSMEVNMKVTKSALFVIALSFLSATFAMAQTTTTSSITISGIVPQVTTITVTPGRKLQQPASFHDHLRFRHRDRR